MIGKRCGAIAATVSIVMLFVLPVLATDAEMYFSFDRNGQNRVTNIQEGDEIWIVVVDNDQNIDCDIRDKMSPDIKIMDIKTGAYIVWDAIGVQTDAVTHHDYLEETGADTGVFVSCRAFQVGTRFSYAAGDEPYHTHVVDIPVGNAVDDFQWGHYIYVDRDDDGFDDNRSWAGGPGSPATDPNWRPGTMGISVLPVAPNETIEEQYLIGRFENMDTLVGLYQDPNDATDVALGMMKIIDTEAMISWDQEIYRDGNETATITVIDPDENLNCNEVEYVPVFIIVNPGSWNPVDGTGVTGYDSPTDFCMLKRTGGVDGKNGALGDESIRWYNIYNADANAAAPFNWGAADGRYYIEYAVEGDDNVSFFNTVDPDGITPVSFYAQETGANTGVFQLNLNSILDDLEFNALDVRDVLVAYYLDPNDFDDFKLATAYIEERQHSITSFTDASHANQEVYWIGRDAVYIQVIDANANVDPCCPEQVVVHVCDPHGEDDAEWLILDETSSDSSVFFTFAGTQLWGVWDPLGVGNANAVGGFQLVLDNWKIEGFNEDDVYVRYNDAYYGAPDYNVLNGDSNNVSFGLAGLGDSNIFTSFPPLITLGGYANTEPGSVLSTVIGPTALYAGVRVANDVSFDLMSIADTQVYDGQATTMYFLDRTGSRVSGYVNSDCVFIEVVDEDQDEDPYRRERIDGYWDGAQNVPFGPIWSVPFECEMKTPNPHPVNCLLGNVGIFNDAPGEDAGAGNTVYFHEPKLYILNPRSGHWAAVDLLETGVATGDFISVTCIDLTSVYSECVPTLDVLPGDTIIAAYQDPTNHSDVAWISIKVGVGGGGTPAGQESTTAFVDANGNTVSTYAAGESVYVLVTDPSHTQDTMLAGVLMIEGVAYDLTTYGSRSDQFFSDAIILDLAAGDEITATYTDPSDPADTSSDTISIIAGELVVDAFYAGPNPFEDEVTFSFHGSGIATQMTVVVYDLSAKKVWASEQANGNEIVWDGSNEDGIKLANGAYKYMVTATDGTNTFSGEGMMFVNR